MLTYKTPNEPFCDYLTVTFSPEDCPIDSVRHTLLSAGYAGERAKDNVVLFRRDSVRGAVRIQSTSRFVSISFSGSVCSDLRASNHWEVVLWDMATSPHRVTRLDAALDFPVDGADFLDAFHALYPTGQCSLSRKALQVTSFTGVRPDGRSTGTAYVGHRSRARATARIYDKQWETYEKHSEYLPSTTRVEVTATRNFGATLRDAAYPSSIFWHIASPAILVSPPDVSPWEPVDMSYTSPPKLDKTDYQVLSDSVESSAQLDAWIASSDRLGPRGREILLRMISERCSRAESSDLDAQAA